MQCISYEKRYTEETKKKAEQKQLESVKENPNAASATVAEAKESKLQNTSTSKTPEDLDVFLLGDLGSDEEGLGMLYFLYSCFQFSIYCTMFICQFMCVYSFVF